LLEFIEEGTIEAMPIHNNHSSGGDTFLSDNAFDRPKQSASALLKAQRDQQHIDSDHVRLPLDTLVAS
jgi:hypothetical protein